MQEVPLMPGVSVALSDQAYEIFKNLEKGRRSKIMSAALLQWYAQQEVYAIERAELRGLEE